MLVVFLVLLALALSPSLQCPLNSFPNKSNDKCYYVITDFKLNFTSAESMCETVNGHLGSIDNKEDAGTVGQAFNKKGIFYIGLNRKNGEWQWADGSPLNQKYAPWVAGGPSPNKDCVMADSLTGLWLAVDCSRTAVLLCNIAARPAKPNCPEGYVCWNGFKYILNETRQDTFWNMETHCQSLGGHLASVHSPDEEQLVETMCAQSSVCSTDQVTWLGGLQNDNSGPHRGPMELQWTTLDRAVDLYKSVVPIRALMIASLVFRSSWVVSGANGSTLAALLRPFALESAKFR